MKRGDDRIGNDRYFPREARGDDVFTNSGEQTILDEYLIGAFGEINRNFVHVASMQEIVNAEKNCFFVSDIK